MRSVNNDAVAELEDLEVLHRGPQWHLDGECVGAAAIARLTGAAQPWPSDAWDEIPVHEQADLVSAGWFTLRGDLGERGVQLRDGLGSRRTIVTLSAVDSVGPRRGWVVVGSRLAVTIIDESATGSGPLDQLSFQVGPANALPIVLARWGALNPSWTSETTHVLSDPSLIRRRVQDAGILPPSGAHDELRELWQQDWTRWGVSVSELEIELEFLAIGGHGQYAVRTRADGAALLVPRPSSLLWGDMQLILAGLPGRSDPDAVETW